MDLKSLGFQLETECSDNEMIFKIKKIENKELKNKIAEFKEYLKEVDDDIFTKACEKFEKVSKITLKEFSKLLEEATAEKIILENITLFKAIIVDVVNDLIKQIKSKYRV